MSSPSSNSSLLFSSLLFWAENFQKFEEIFRNFWKFPETAENLLYVLAVKQGLLKEKQDGTYTPIFEAGKKGLINVLHRWYALSVEHEIPMPTYEDIANKVRKENGEAYNKNSIRNYLSRVGSLE